ncbi:MAG: flippase-like domain-containing protein [Chloroflexi bacterium]|nr:flippase-like domain-containing protein [Chloroflexota bacterium]
MTGSKWGNRITRLLPAIGLVMLVLILRSVDLERASAIVSSADISLLLLSLCLVAAEAATKTLKLRILTSVHRTCTFGTSLRVYLTGILFGAISPSKVGDFVKVYTLSQETGLRLMPSLAIVTVERTIEIVCLLTLTALGAVALARIEGIDPLVIASGAALCACVLAGVWTFSRRIIVRFVKWFFRRLVSVSGGRLGERSFEAFGHFVWATYRQPGQLILAMLLGFAAWGVVLVRSYTQAVALGVSVDFLAFVLLYPIVIAVELMPISYLGLGTREFAIAYLLAKFNVPVERAVVLSLLGFVLTMVPLVLAGYAAVITGDLRHGGDRVAIGGESDGRFVRSDN